MCLGQRLVGFEISPFYQDVQFGSQIGFAYKSNAFTAVFDATIIQPMILQIYVQPTQKYIGLYATFDMTPFQKSLKWCHPKEALQNQWFWIPLLYTVKDPHVL